MLKRFICLAITIVFVLGTFAGCGQVATTENTDDTKVTFVHRGPAILPSGIRFGMSIEEVEKCLGESLGDGKPGDSGGEMYTLSADFDAISAFYGVKYMQQIEYALDFDSDGALKNVAVMLLHTQFSSEAERDVKLVMDYSSIVNTLNGIMGEGTEDEQNLVCDWEKDGVEASVYVICGSDKDGVTLIAGVQ